MTAEKCRAKEGDVAPSSRTVWAMLKALKADLESQRQRTEGLRERIEGLSEHVEGLSERVEGQRQRLEGLSERIEGQEAELGLLRGVSGPFLRRSVVEAAQLKLEGLPGGLGARWPQESGDQYAERLSRAPWLEEHQLTPDTVRLLLKVSAGTAFGEGCSAVRSQRWEDRPNLVAVCLDGVAEEDKPHWEALFHFARRR